MSKFFSFLKGFGQKKIEQSGEGIIAFLNSVDRDTCTDVQIQLIEDKRDDYGRKLIDAKRELERDLEETAAVEHSLKQAKSLLLSLKEKYDSGDTSVAEQAAKVNVRLGELQVELERELQEDKDAQELVATLQSVYDALCNKLKEVRGQIQAAGRRLDNAKAKQERQDLIRAAKGETAAFESMDIIIESMDKEAAKIEREMELNDMNSASTKKEDDVDVMIRGHNAPVKDDSPFSNL